MPERRVSVWHYLAAALVVAAVWELLPRSGLVPTLFLPALSSSLHELGANRLDFADALLVTIKEIVFAYLLACIGGVASGLAIGASARLSRALSPWLRAAYAVPYVILYPAFLVWFGLGGGSKVAFAAVYAIVPVILATVAGVAAIDRRLIDCGRALAATPAQVIICILLPASLPAIIGALRLGGALVIVGVIVAEMLASIEGLGFLISKHRTLFNSAGVYAGVLVVIAVSGLHELLLYQLSSRALRHRAGAEPG